MATHFLSKTLRSSSTLWAAKKLKEDELVVSFDVVSLFTSVPVEMAVDVVREKLGEIQVWKKYTKLTEDQVVPSTRELKKQEKEK